MTESTSAATRNLVAFNSEKTEFHLHHTQEITSQNTKCVYYKHQGFIVFACGQPVKVYCDNYKKRTNSMEKRGAS